LQSVLRILRNKGIAVSIADISSDIGVPVFTCTLIDDPNSVHWRAIPKIAGHGAHLQPHIAISRALHEAIQSRVTVIGGSRDDLFPRDYLDSSGREAQLRALEEFAHTPYAFAGGPAAASESFEGDLQALLRLLQARGIRTVVAVNLSRDDVGIPVVKVVVPGLEQVRTPLYRPGVRARQLLQQVAA
jgi:YcaO-like protein with predicted kinase domain